MKTILICGPQGNQKALAHKIAKICSLSDIVVCTGYKSRKRSFSLVARVLWQKICSILVGLKFRSVWFGVMNYYESIYPAFPLVPSLICSDVNDRLVIEKVSTIKPELIVVSGTNLLGSQLIDEILKYGQVVNLHTGISPYIKGGPNCTNWCLAIREFGLIGNTVMWLSSGIDSGNLIATERTALTGNESLLDLHIKVMEHAHDLYVRCIGSLAGGKLLPDVSQNDFPVKRLFLSRHWGLYEMISALLNFYLYFHMNSKYLHIPSDIKLVSLNSEVQPLPRS